jgi:transcriptional regulator with XRE-family HTH domain
MILYALYHKSLTSNDRQNRIKLHKERTEMFQREAVSVDVGKRLRELREARNISMRALAAKSGLSANALSMIERGRTSPSVSTLYKLADALGVPITAFFGADSEKESVILIRADERKRVPFSRGVWEGLGGERFIGRVEPFVLTLESGASSGIHSMVHSGHEFVFCLRGQLEYQVENKVFRLEAGDSLLFAANLHHRWRNPGDTVTNALIVLSGFSENEQPHGMHWKSGE